MKYDSMITIIAHNLTTIIEVEFSALDIYDASLKLERHVKVLSDVTMFDSLYYSDPKIVEDRKNVE
jgi:phage-related protein